MEDFTPLPQESTEPYFNVGKLKVVVNCSVFSAHQTPKQKLQWLQLTFGFLKVKFVWVRKFVFGCKKRCWKFILSIWSSEALSVTQKPIQELNVVYLKSVAKTFTWCAEICIAIFLSRQGDYHFYLYSVAAGLKLEAATIREFFASIK